MHMEFPEVEHRPFPHSNVPWFMTQQWNNMAMFHWPIDTALLEKQIPEQLKIDTFDGVGWLSFAVFQVTHSRIRGFPKVPYFSTFIQINVRTYVTYNGVSGVYFFSLDANKWPIVFGAKVAMKLPYKLAQMTMKNEQTDMYFNSSRKKTGSGSPAFTCQYRPTSESFYPGANSLDYWLLERYCLWTTKGKSVFRSDIHHDRWKVTQAKATIHENSIATFLPQSSFQTEPLLHFTNEKTAFLWPLRLII